MLLSERASMISSIMDRRTAAFFFFSSFTGSKIPNKGKERKGKGKEKERKRKGKGKEKERKRKGKGKEKERKRKGKGKEKERKGGIFFQSMHILLQGYTVHQDLILGGA
jgi:hypothetical protein